MNQEMANLLQQFSQFLYLKSLHVEKSPTPSSIHPEISAPSLLINKSLSPSILASQSLLFPECIANINNILSAYENLKADVVASTTTQFMQPWIGLDQSNKPLYRAHVNYQSSKPLRDWWDQNIKDPYPTKDDIEKLSNATGFTHKQVRDWFTNRRRRFEEKIKGKPLPWNKKATYRPYVCDSEKKTDNF